MPKPLQLLSFLTIGIVLSAAPALAHPISLSSAIVDVREDRITAEIEIMLEDLVLYNDLQAGDDYRFAGDELNEAAENHRAFVLKYFSIRDADGDRLAAKIANVDTSKIVADGVAQTALMTKSVTYDLQFDVAGRQKFMTFSQTFGGPRAVLPAVMDLMLLQNGILIERPVQLTLGQPHTAEFDWDNPPIRPPRGLAELRKKRQEQLRQRLGIASYGGLYSFIYVTNSEVRHEILIPLLTLERWLPIVRKNPDFIEVSEQAAARDKIAEFFRQRNPLEINDAAIEPELTRLNFFGLNINDFALNAAPRRVSVYQARVGVILSYRPKTSSAKVAMRWETFNEFAPFLRSIVLVGDDDPQEHFFREESPTFGWARAETGPELPAVKVVKGQSAQISEEETKEVVSGLLKNIYAAFEFHQDGDVYDALAAGVTGDLLRQLYLQIKRWLLMAEQGGALSRVKQLKVISAQRQAGASQTEFRCRCRWRVLGTVEHWGHIHTREKEYDAQLTIQWKDGTFKISGVQVLSENRVRFETSLRGYNRNRKSQDDSGQTTSRSSG
jgi:hypothetical protein